MLPPSTQAAARWAKILLLAAIALFFTLVAFNNITDFDTNYQFVRHVLAMDTTFPNNHSMWRAIRSPAIHLAFYILLNLAVGGRWPGSPDDTTIFPQRMLVDYVRVYSREPKPSSAATKPGAPYLDSEMWASSEGQPSLAFVTRTQPKPKPTQ